MIKVSTFSVWFLKKDDLVRRFWMDFKRRMACGRFAILSYCQCELQFTIVNRWNRQLVVVMVPLQIAIDRPESNRLPFRLSKIYWTTGLSSVRSEFDHHLQWRPLVRSQSTIVVRTAVQHIELVCLPNRFKRMAKINEVTQFEWSIVTARYWLQCAILSSNRWLKWKPWCCH